MISYKYRIAERNDGSFQVQYKRIGMLMFLDRWDNYCTYSDLETAEKAIISTLLLEKTLREEKKGREIKKIVKVMK